MRGSWVWSLALGGIVLMAASCHLRSGTDAIDWSVSLSHKRSTPYGSSLAFESLPDYFPNAHIEPLSAGFRYTSIDGHLDGGEDSASLLVLLGLDFHLTRDEWTNLIRFAAAGNEVFLLSSQLDARVARSISMKKIRKGDEEQPLNIWNDGTGEQHALQLHADSGRRYGYHGRPIRSYFSPDAASDKTEADEDSGSEAALNAARMEALIQQPEQVLGTADGKPDFIRYQVGKGHLTLHAAPLVLSNYFLLQPHNRQYLDGIWHRFPANISKVYWNEYYRRSEGGSSLSVLFRYPAMRRAIWLALLALGLYVVLGLRRKQRIVPVISPPENTSVAFAETVGRLYFNQGNHANLAGKMVQQFLEFVRTRYYLDTSELTPDFERRLAAKSGRPLAEVKALVGRIHDLRLGTPVSAEYLYQLHHELEKFYAQQ